MAVRPKLSYGESSSVEQDADPAVAGACRCSASWLIDLRSGAFRSSVTRISIFSYLRPLVITVVSTVAHEACTITVCKGSQIFVAELSEAPTQYSSIGILLDWIADLRICAELIPSPVLGGGVP